MSIACFLISLQNGGLLSSENQLVLMDVIGSKCVWKSRCDWSTHSVVSWESHSIFTCELVWKISGLNLVWNFSDMKFFHTWNRCEFSIRHVQPCSTCGIFNLHTFKTCFWCESGMKQAWSYENILYGRPRRWLTVVYVIRSRLPKMAPTQNALRYVS